MTLPQKQLATGMDVFWALQFGHDQLFPLVAKKSETNPTILRTVILGGVRGPTSSASNVEKLKAFGTRPNRSLTSDHFEANHALVAVAHDLGDHICCKAGMAFGNFANTLVCRFLCVWFFVVSWHWFRCASPMSGS